MTAVRSRSPTERLWHDGSVGSRAPDGSLPSSWRRLRRVCAAWSISRLRAAMLGNLATRTAAIDPIPVTASNSYAAARLQQYVLQYSGEIASLRLAQKAAQGLLLALGYDPQVRATIGSFMQIHPRPIGVAVKLFAPTRRVHARQAEFCRRQLDDLAQAAGAIA